VAPLLHISVIKRQGNPATSVGTGSGGAPFAKLCDFSRPGFKLQSSRIRDTRVVGLSRRSSFKTCETLIIKGLFIKDVRGPGEVFFNEDKGVLQMRTSALIFGAKIRDFLKFMVCLHKQGWKRLSQRAFCGQVGRGSIFRRILRASFMDDPLPKSYKIKANLYFEIFKICLLYLEMCWHCLLMNHRWLQSF